MSYDDSSGAKACVMRLVSKPTYLQRDCEDSGSS